MYSSVVCSSPLYLSFLSSSSSSSSPSGSRSCLCSRLISPCARNQVQVAITDENDCVPEFLQSIYSVDGVPEAVTTATSILQGECPASRVPVFVVTISVSSAVSLSYSLSLSRSLSLSLSLSPKPSPTYLPLRAIRPTAVM